MERPRRPTLVASLAIGAIVACSLASISLLRRPPVANTLCRAAAAIAGRELGLSVAVGSCRLDPLDARLELLDVNARDPRAGGREIAIDSIDVAFRPLQAVLGGLWVRRLEIQGGHAAWRSAPGHPMEKRPGSAGPCWIDWLRLVHVEQLALHRIQLAIDLGEEHVDVASLDATAALRARIYEGTVEATGHVGREGASRAALVFRLDPRAHSLAIGRLLLAMTAGNLVASGEVRDVCKPSSTLRLKADLPVPLLASLLSPHLDGHGTLSVGYVAEGPHRPASVHVTAHDARILNYRIGDLDAEAVIQDGLVRLHHLHLPLDEGGAVDVTGTVMMGPVPTLDLHAALARIDLARLLDRVDIRHSLVDFRFNGHAHLAGRMFGPFLLRGEGAGEASGLTVDDWGWDRTVPRHRILTGPAPFQVATRLTVDAEGVHLEKATIQGGGDEIEGDAFIHYDPSKGLKLEARAVHLDLGKLERLAWIPWRGEGSATLSVEGPYSDPLLTGHAALDDFHFLGIDFGHVAVDLSFRGNTLTFPIWLGSLGKTAYSGSGKIDLSHDFESEFDLDVPSGRLEDLTLAVQDLAPPMADVHRALAGAFSGHARLKGPIAVADAGGEIALGAFSVFGREFAEGVIDARLERGRDVQIDRLTARQGTGAPVPGITRGIDGRLEATGRVGVDGALALSLRGVGLSLADLLWARGRGASAQGRLRVEGGIGGTLAAWEPSGEARIEGFRAFGVPLGTASLTASTKADTLRFSGMAGDEERVEGAISLHGAGPFEATIRGATGQLERYLRGYGFRDPPSGSLAGDVRLGGEILVPERTKGELRIDRLALARGALRVATEGVTRIGLDAGALSLSEAVLVGKNSRLTLSGTRDAEGIVQGAVKGQLDVGLLEGLVPSIEHLGGVFRLGAEVHGSLERPAIVGTARFEDGRFDWIGWPLSIRDFSGVAEFSERRVVLGRSHGRLNGGTADLAGDLGMDGWQVERCNLESNLDEVPFSIPDSIPSVVTGRLSLDGALAAGLLMSGELHVVRARYSKDFEIDRLLQAFSATGALRNATAPQKGAPLHLDIWLRGDGDLKVQNNVAELALAGDLHLTGTNERTGLVGTLTAKDGLAQFRGNEYHVSDATLTLLEPDRIAPSFDISADTDVRQYRVFVHAFGTPQSYQLSLRSQPELAEDDVVKLLAFGVTSQDAASMAGAAGQAGYLGDVLWNISGLHDQVKKIIPKNRVIRDFSFNIGSAFLEATGQVEPVAQIESRVFSDSLRLRAQVPLSEYSGKRAEAEYQLSDHMSLQGEWNNDYSDYNIGDLGLDLRMRWEFGE